MIRLLFATALAFLALSEPAAAAPIGTLIAGAWAALKATVAAGGIGAALIRLAASTALSLLAARLGPRQATPGVRIGGVGSTEDFPRSTVLGRYAAAASLVYHNSWGSSGKTPNAYYTAVYALDDRPGARLLRVALGESWVTLDATPHPQFGFPVLEYRANNRDHAWMRFYDGTQTAADPFLLARFGSDPQWPWSPDMVGQGVCYAVATFLLVNRKVFPNGLPQVLFELEGAGLYDPRRDSTAGGLGPQRRNDPTSWEPTRNLAVIAGAVARGVALPGGRVWGGGADVPDAVLAAAANVCDELDAPGGRPRFQGGVQIALPEAEPAGVLEEVLSAGLGQAAFTGVDLHIAFGEPAVPLVSFTDDDIVITEQVSEAAFPGLDQAINALRIRHPDPARLYQPVQTPERIDPDALAADGRYNPAALQLPAVLDHEQAQEVAAGLLADARRFLSFTLALPPDLLMRLVPGDTVAWTSARHGFEDKLFEVSDVETDLVTLFGFVVLRERDPGDFAAPVTQPLPAPPPPAPVPERGIFTWSAEPVTLVDDEAGPRRPDIRLIWDEEQVEDAPRVAFEVEHLASGTLVIGGLLAAEAGSGLTGGALLPATGYRVRMRPDLEARETVWTGWIAVTTPDVRLGAEDLQDGIRTLITTLDGWIAGGAGDVPERLEQLGDDLAAETQARIDAVGAEAQARLELALQQADRWRETRDRIAAISAELLEVLAHADGQRQALRTTLSVEVGAARASFDQSIAVVVSDLLSAVQRVTSLEAQSAEFTAEIGTLETALTTGLDALGLLITQISVGSATAFDTAHIWYFDTAVEGWTGLPDAPVVAAPGFLRPAAASYVMSPAGLGVAGATYGQVRARLRRAGNPEWVGQLWWEAAGEGWDAARRIAIDEPVWSDGVGVVTWLPEWTGILDRIRLDLAAGVDGANWIEIDWIGIGRPAPGASSADVASERLARISADEALAVAIDATQAAIDDPATGLGALAGTLSSQQSQLGVLDGRVTAEAQRIDAVEAEIADPATGLAALASAIDTLTTLVEEGADGQVVAAEAVRALRSVLAAVSAEVLEGLAVGEERLASAREIVATAVQTLTTRIDSTDGALAVVAEAVTALQVLLPDLASAEALQALTTRVEVAEGTITSQSAALTSLASRLDGAEGVNAAQASAISGLDTRVTAAEGTITSQAAALTSLTSRMGAAEGVNATQATAISGLDTRVTAAEGTITSQAAALTSLTSRMGAAEGVNATQATAISGLDTRVTAAEGTITAQAAALTSLTSRVDGAEGVNAAQATALTGLETRVTSAEGEIVAQAAALTSVTAATDPENPATANFRLEAQTGPAGFAQIGFQTRVGGAGEWRSAGLFLQTPTDPELPSRIAATADQFVFATPGGAVVPFVASGSELRVSVPIESVGYVAGVAGFRLDPATGAIDAGSLTVRRGNVLRGSLSATFFLQSSSPFNGVATFGTWTSIGTQEFTVPAAETDVPDRIVIRPAIGGKLPFFNNSAGQSSLTLGALYRFRLLLRRGGVTVETTAWGEAPFWQFNWQNTVGTTTVTYGCVPSEVSFWVDTEELGVEPGDTIRVEYEYRRDRVSVPNANASPGFGVEHLTLEARVEYFYR